MEDNPLHSPGLIIYWDESPDGEFIVLLRSVPLDRKTFKFNKTQIPPVCNDRSFRQLQLDNEYHFIVRHNEHTGQVTLVDIEQYSSGGRPLSRIGPMNLVQVKLRLDPATLGPHGYVESVHPWFNHAGNVYYPQLRAPVRGEYHEVWCRLRMRATVLGLDVLNDWEVLTGPTPNDVLTDRHVPIAHGPTCDAIPSDFVLVSIPPHV